MAGIIDTLKLKYKTGSVMTRLIFINVAVFYPVEGCRGDIYAV